MFRCLTTWQRPNLTSDSIIRLLIDDIGGNGDVANEANPLPVGHKTGAPIRRTSTRGAYKKAPAPCGWTAGASLANLSGEPNQVRVFGGASAYDRSLLGFRV